MKKRPIFNVLFERLQEPRKFIQVLLGPRQVGKTTLAIQVSDTLKKPCHYISADLATLQDLTWLQQQWEVARKKVTPTKGGLLIIDEVQKFPIGLKQSKHYGNMTRVIKSIYLSCFWDLLLADAKRSFRKPCRAL